MVTVIEAPGELTIQGRSVFLAGGITDCPKWQSVVIKRLREQKLDGTLINPRRSEFGEGATSREQIEWEFRALEQADVFSIYFTDGPSPQPISLYELGRCLARRSAFEDMIVTTHPDYKRREDVLIQTELAAPGLTVHDSLDAHITAIRNTLKTEQGC